MCCHRIPPLERPALILSAEAELGITAGLQDRVIQVHGLGLGLGHCVIYVHGWLGAGLQARLSGSGSQVSSAAVRAGVRGGGVHGVPAQLGGAARARAVRLRCRAPRSPPGPCGSATVPSTQRLAVVHRSLGHRTQGMRVLMSGQQIAAISVVLHIAQLLSREPLN